jgi:DNA polymerase I-like protein with 3'-5' exonuclease and polymerase domains
VRLPPAPGKPLQIVTLRHTDRLNSPIQGTAVDVLKVAMARLWRGKDQFHVLKFALVVHDEVVLQCARCEAEAVARWAQAEMEAAGREVVAGVDLPVEYVIGRDWSGTPLTDSAARD